VNGVLITSLYAPNGNPQPGPKFTDKLAWMDRLLAHAADLFAVGVPIVLAGDFNVVPTDRDIYPTKSYDKDALLQPESRARYARLLREGWCDAIPTASQAFVAVDQPAVESTQGVSRPRNLRPA
jgi:exodeoxyribonuclease III